MKTIIAAVLLTTLHASTYELTALEQPTNVVSLENEVRQMERERLDAILRNDVKALDRMIASEYTAITSQNPGRLTTKKEALAINSPDTRKIHSWNPKDVTVRIYGDVGLVTGLAEVVDVLRGQSRHVVFQYSHIWVKRKGYWQLVHRHVNRLASVKEADTQ